MKRSYTILSIGITLFFLIGMISPLSGQSRLPSKKHKVLPASINELSGLVFVEKGQFLAHNDSGNPNDLFLLNLNGEILNRLPLLKTKNIDWEDICFDGKGNIFLGDFGNNANKRRSFQIYKINLESMEVDTIEFHLKEQTNFDLKWLDRHYDMEAMIWSEGFLYIFTKDSFKSKKCITYLYKIDPKIKQQAAQLIDSISFTNTVITGASIHPETKKIALVGYYGKYWLNKRIPSSHLIFLENYESDHFFKGTIKQYRIPRFGFTRQYESIDFLSNNTVIVGSERGIFSKKSRIDWFKIPD